MIEVPTDITEGDLVVVYWTDTEDSSNWEDLKLSQLVQPPPAKHYGLYICHDENCIRGAYAVVGRDTEVDVGRWVIPRICITKIEKIRDDELSVV